MKETFSLKLLEADVIWIYPFSNRLSQEVPPPIQCPRCLANYGILRFVDPIAELAGKLVEHMIKHSSTTGEKYIVVRLRFKRTWWLFLLHI